MYHTEQITDKSYSEIQQLYRLSFGTYYSIESIQQKYNTVKFGIKNIGIIAKSQDNELAAYYGVFPIILTFKKQDYLVAQSGDTMTAPKHRKKGLFTKLAKETFDLSEEKGIKMIFGFPNENSYPGFKHKLNWEFHDFMQKFTFYANTIPLCELSSKLTQLKPLYEKFVKNRIKKHLIEIDNINFDLFNFSNVDGYIKKDKKFFEYKLKRGNTYIVLINNLQILIKVDVHLYIGEVGKIENNQSELLIKSIKKLAAILGCRKIIFTLSKNHWLFDILKNKNTPMNSLPIGFYLIDKNISPSEIQFSNADYDTF